VKYHINYQKQFQHMLVLFSIWRTDRSNAKFDTFTLGKTDNARRRRAADTLPPSLSEAELVLQHCSHWYFHIYLVGSRRSGGIKM